MRTRHRRSLGGAAGLLLAGGREASAHAFGSRYDLPLPLDLYLLGAGGIVLLSFLVLLLFMRSTAGRRRWQRVVSRPATERSRLPALAAAAFGAAAFLLIVVAGLFGAQSATSNIAPLAVWVLWWIGFLFLCTFVANLWPAVNPWTALFRFGRALAGRRASRAEGPAAGGPPAGRWWDGWLACLLFFLFAWLELVSDVADSPRRLAIAILAFSLLTWVGMARLGPTAWLGRIDPFHRVFGLFGSFAPLGRDAGGRLLLRPPAAGLLDTDLRSLGDVAFVVLVLSTVSFDGLAETPVWQAIVEWVAESRTLRPFLLWLDGLGVDLLAAVKTLGMLTTALLFMLVFAGVCRLVAWCGGGEASTGRVMRRFAPSLLPIAIAYHLSHYLSYLLLAGQLAIPLASDPLGLGWNLFGTRDRGIDVGVIGAKAIWHVAIAAIVTGHVLSVALAHTEALRLFPTRRRALLSQIPMLLLMIAFTMCSLWILSQPIVQEAG